MNVRIRRTHTLLGLALAYSLAFLVVINAANTVSELDSKASVDGILALKLHNNGRVLGASVPSANGAPVLFFSDLQSGPSTGGENNNGAYVTLYGNNFGTNPTVTVGGGQAIVKLYPTNYLWYQKMIIQLGAGAQSGDIIVTNQTGTSNSLPFTIRAGNIYFVATTGSNSNPGTFSLPWQTLPFAVQNTQAGDTIYAKDGVSQSADDGQGWNGSIVLRTAWCQGTDASPKALIAYPGATVTIGNTSGSVPATGLRTTDFTATGGGCGGHWVFSGLNLRGIMPLFLASGDNYRIVGNDISNPLASGGGGGGAALETSLATHVKILGNHGHDLNLASTDALQQGFYLSTDSNHAEVAYNSIHHTMGRCGLQTHSSPVNSATGYVLYDISIHDNLIYDTNGEGMCLDTLDPSKGPVVIYNNVLHDTGKGGPRYAAIYRAISSDFNQGQGVGSGTVEIYNNTAWNFAGGYGFSATFEVHHDQAIVNRLRNNIFWDSTGTAAGYVTTQTDSSTNYTSCGNSDTLSTCPVLSGSNNLMFGHGAPSFPNNLTATVNLDPKLVSVADAHLQSVSPAISGATTVSGLLFDFDGIVRPQGTAYDIGAYEFPTGTSTPPVPPVSDITPPVISAIQVTGIGVDTATVTWTTDEPATSVVEYGSTISYGQKVTDTNLVTSHKVIISGLVGASSYNFRVVSADSSNNITFSPDNSFITTVDPNVQTGPAAITNLSSYSPTKSSIRLKWTAPGGNGNSGTALYYDVRYSTSPITAANWAQATSATGEPAPALAGTVQNYTVGNLRSATKYYAAMTTTNSSGITSPLSNVITFTTKRGGK